MNLRSLRSATRESLSQAAYPPGKLAAIYAGVIALVSLLVSIANYYLGNAIDTTGGLSGMGDRAMLSTLRTVLNFAFFLLIPLWNLGFLATALGIARKKDVSPVSLTQGLRRFWPVLRMYILQAIIIFFVVTACWQVGSILFIFSPFSDKTVAVLEALALEVTQKELATIPSEDLMTFLTSLNEEQLGRLVPTFIPMYVICGVLITAVGLPLLYRFRLMSFAIVSDVPKARRSLLHATRISRGRKWRILVLDLYFWWYYAAQVLIAMIPSVPMILTLANVTLPLSETVLSLILYGLYLALQFLLTWLFGMKVQTTYAHLYDAMQADPPTPFLTITKMPDPMPPQQPQE